MWEVKRAMLTLDYDPPPRKKKAKKKLALLEKTWVLGTFNTPVTLQLGATLKVITAELPAILETLPKDFTETQCPKPSIEQGISTYYPGTQPVWGMSLPTPHTAENGGSPSQS